MTVIGGVRAGRGYVPLHVVDTEGDFRVVTGEALEIDRRGMVAHVDERLPCTCQTTVQIDLPCGGDLVADVVVAGARHDVDGEGWTYRMVFVDLEGVDVAAIAAAAAGG